MAYYDFIKKQYGQALLNPDYQTRSFQAAVDEMLAHSDAIDQLREGNRALMKLSEQIEVERNQLLRKEKEFLDFGAETAKDVPNGFYFTKADVRKIEQMRAPEGNMGTFLYDNMMGNDVIQPDIITIGASGVDLLIWSGQRGPGSEQYKGIALAYHTPIDLGRGITGSTYTEGSYRSGNMVQRNPDG